MADKNVQMKVLNSSGTYDTINPVSNANLIKCTDGTSVETKFTTKSNLSTLVSTSLSASAWTGSDAPYSQTISVAGVTATSANELLPGASITADQLDALQSANIQDGGQAAGHITLLAYGDKPGIDLPVRVIVRGDL